ncbi:MAG: elongation factor Ts [Candidatus Moranbacteria bacterium CG_4_9_14_3_um_filter_40_7]|nr:MAG: elongation factor Ts [Candidatus Moranbacteria bacterium CG23_combo_of_CG06-09_8_20_14_all_40_16]PIU80538.1 MAG: elongation factor Ts [Candidatus Moranbacteria bacterium CG06_land_8_20_14_3_00_40_12]PJA88167.1 MAG: elongation factor Ts [Candidatus Moranbacteria bacterium CG_4_9_14_3_um_filter_40_7]
MDLEKIKNLREKTGAGVVDVKKALEKSKGNETLALEIIRKKGQEIAAKKTGRSAKEGILGVYVHSTNKVGAMVKLFCETDFVGRNEEFKELAKDLAMHITASSPEYLNPEDVPSSRIEKERDIWREQFLNQGKKETMLDKILEGKEKKFREEIALMAQPFVKNPEITVKELIQEKIGKIGENIQVGEFFRFEI